MKLKTLKQFAISLAALVVPIFVLAAPPSFPHLFYGTVLLNGAPAAPGTVIIAETGGVERGSIIMIEEGVYGRQGAFQPKLAAQGDIAEESEIIFLLNGVAANETAVFTSGAISELNLTFDVSVEASTSTSPDSSTDSETSDKGTENAGGSSDSDSSSISSSQGGGGGGGGGVPVGNGILLGSFVSQSGLGGGQLVSSASISQAGADSGGILSDSLSSSDSSFQSGGTSVETSEGQSGPSLALDETAILNPFMADTAEEAIESPRNIEENLSGEIVLGGAEEARGAGLEESQPVESGGLAAVIGMSNAAFWTLFSVIIGLTGLVYFAGHYKAKK